MNEHDPALSPAPCPLSPEQRQQQLAIERERLALYLARRSLWQQSRQVNEDSGKGKAARSQISRLSGLILRCQERIRELEGAEDGREQEQINGAV